MTNGFAPTVGTNYGAARQQIINQPNVNVPLPPVVSGVTPGQLVQIQPQQPTSTGVNPTQIINAASRLPSVNTGITSVIDDFGYDVFGVGQQVAGPFTGPGPFTTGVSGGLSTQVRSVINPTNIAAGFAGNLVADAFGLSGEYSNIGSTIGGAVGSSFGPVGTAVGSFLGSAIGGAFGGPDPNPWSIWNTYDSGYNPDGTLKGQATLSNKHISGEAGTNVGNMVTDINQKVHQLTGMDMSGVKNIGGYEKNYGGFISLNSPFHKDGEHYNPENVFYFDPANPDETNQAAQSYARRLMEWGGVEQQDIDRTMNELFSSQEAKQGNTNYYRTEPILPMRQESGKETFEQFLTKYRENYNANAVK